MKTARLAARQLLKNYSFIDYVTNLYAIAAKIGIVIYKTDKLPDNVLGSARLTNTGIWVIVVNSNQIFTRLRFTIAHEIGHIVLNHSHSEYHLATPHNTWQEREANIFASELLMPVTKFKDLYFNRHITDDLDIAKYFKVSKQAADIRISEITGK
ncbi:MAG TPA: ImmA/IrrE family metallo-endopeptidase [candidate division Zixibacteria bacterium]|nr:ImmA/IrrE family metallo-endopeptidase [candidate division Zixibacteria bacterium]